MRLWLSLLALTLPALLVLRPQTPDPADPHQALVPPERVRVTLGDEVVELALGETLRRPGQPELRVELLPTRRFELPGVLAFDFPGKWSASGLLATPEPSDAWWNLGGTDVSLYLRRHAGDARAVLDECATNLERAGSHAREPLRRQFGARTLDGLQVRYSTGSFHGAATQERVQELYAFTAGGHAYLLTFDLLLATPPVVWIDLATFPDGSPGRALTLPSHTASAEFTTLLASWRWLDG